MQHIDAGALDGTTWAEHRALVLTKIAENSDSIAELRRAVQQMAVVHSVEIAKLTVKSGIFGFLGGVVSVLTAVGLAIIVWLVKK